MRTAVTDGRLIIELESRIDSGNAPDVEAGVMEAVSACEYNEICFDAANLTYISSAGLRVFMKVRKQSDKPLTIVNVSRDVYDIFDATGFTQLFNIKRAYRRISTDGLEVVGQGFFGTVYRLDPETIVKMYKGKDIIPLIENEKQMAQKAFLAGIPTAISYDIVQAGEDYGSVFELLNARTFHDIAKESGSSLEDVIIQYTDLLKLVHGIVMKTGDFPSVKERFLDYLEIIRSLLAPGQYEGLRKLLTAVPDEVTIVHGDIQMKNVMQTADGPMLIDMETIGLGNPVFDLSSLYMTYKEFREDDPGNAKSFLGMTNEMVDEIWRLIVKHYFKFKDDADEKRILDRVRLTAAIRFLFLLETTDLKNGELGKRRIEHTREHIDELLKTVECLEI